MTKQAEQVTVAFDDQIWAPANGIPVQAEGWTPLSFMAWFHQATRPTKGLAKLLRMQSGPISLSTALAYGFRYRAENGRLVPQWVALSRAEEERLSKVVLPANTRLALESNALFLHFERPKPLGLRGPIELLRCSETLDPLHHYIDRGADVEAKRLCPNDC